MDGSSDETGRGAGPDEPEHEPGGPGAVDPALREKVLGLGESSIRKNYYPALQQRLREIAASEQRLRAIFDSASDGLLIVEPHTARVLDCNERACQLYGFERQEMLARTIGELSAGEPQHDQTAALDWLRRTMERGASTFEWLIRTSSGVRVWVEVSLRAARIGEQDSAIAAVRDITERKRTFEELAKAQRLESVGLLAGGIAHDFNNLLAGMFSAVELARLVLPPGSPALGPLESFLEAFGRARALTRQLLTFAKGAVVVRTSVNLATLLGRALQFSLAGSATRQELVVEPEKVRVSADANQLMQLFSNLFINARQAMEDGGALHVSCRLRQLGENSLGVTPGPVAEVVVRDEGPGIAPELQPKIFDPFFTTRAGGSGLGLSIVYSVVRRHGGHVAVHSVPGQGTTFSVLLPASDEGADEAPALLPAPAGRPGAHRRVLILDDEALVRQPLARMLTRLGLEVVECGTGEAAIEEVEQALAAGRPFDLAIFDLTIVGGMGGAQAIRRVRQLQPGIRAVVSTGYGSETHGELLGPELFDELLAKPYPFAELTALVERLIGKAG